MYFWGTYCREDYGLIPAKEKTDIADVASGYIKRYWQGGLELLCMMLECYYHTQDDLFFEETLLPIATEILAFYEKHYPKESNGEIRFEPAQALETLWDVVNPVPEIAGLTRAITLLLNVSTGSISAEKIENWKNLLYALPPLPIKEKGDKAYLDNCEINRGNPNNIENISMYAAFPYRQFGVNKPDLEILENTFAMRPFTGVYRCWSNDNVFAAYIGDTNEARRQLAARYVYHEGYRFPTFYVEGDWVPDHDNGGVAQQTLQAMLMQTDGKEILLFPAFPDEWDAEFKLNAPYNTTVEVKRENGRLTYLSVKPKSRLKDIIFFGESKFI